MEGKGQVHHSLQSRCQFHVIAGPLTSPEQCAFLSCVLTLWKDHVNGPAGTRDPVTLGQEDGVRDYNPVCYVGTWDSRGEIVAWVENLKGAALASAFLSLKAF